MEITSILGIVAAIAFVVLGIIMGGGEIGSFIDMSSIMVTIGGSFSAMFVAYAISDVKGLPKLLGNALKKSKINVHGAIESIINLANIARKEGLLALEEAVKDITDPFLQKGIMLIVDGTDPELVKGILETEISFTEARHKKGAGMMDALAGFAPAFGMIGTLIGLINMLKNLSDPSSLGSGMATALVTTFYGSFLANVLFSPMASKLKNKSADEVMYKEVMLEGMLSIQAGENPRIIEEKLNSFLAKGQRKSGQDNQAGGGGEA